MDSLQEATQMAKNILGYRTHKKHNQKEVTEYLALCKQYEKLCADRPGLDAETNQPFSEDLLKSKAVKMLGDEFDLHAEVWGEDSKGNKGRIDFVCKHKQDLIPPFGIEVKAPKAGLNIERFGVDLAFQAVSYMDYTFGIGNGFAQPNFKLDFVLVYPQIDLFFDLAYDTKPLKMLLHRFRVGSLESHHYKKYRFRFADDTTYFDGQNGLVNNGAVLNKTYSGNVNTKRG